MLVHHRMHGASQAVAHLQSRPCGTRPAGAGPSHVAGSLRPGVAGEKCERPNRGRRHTRALRPLPDHRRRGRQVLPVLRRQADRGRRGRRVRRRDGSVPGADRRPHRWSVRELRRALSSRFDAVSALHARVREHPRHAAARIPSPPPYRSPRRPRSPARLAAPRRRRPRRCWSPRPARRTIRSTTTPSAMTKSTRTNPTI